MLLDELLLPDELLDELLLPDELLVESAAPCVCAVVSIPAASLPAIDPSFAKVHVTSKLSIFEPAWLVCSDTDGVLTSVTLIDWKLLNVWITFATLSRLSAV